MNEIRTYILRAVDDGGRRAPLVGPYSGDVPPDACILHAELDPCCEPPQVRIDAIVPVANVPVRRQFQLVNHGCCGTPLGPKFWPACMFKVAAPEGAANGRLYLFEEVQ